MEETARLSLFCGTTTRIERDAYSSFTQDVVATQTDFRTRKNAKAGARAKLLMTLHYKSRAWVRNLILCGHYFVWKIQ